MKLTKKIGVHTMLSRNPETQRITQKPWRGGAARGTVPGYLVIPSLKTVPLHTEYRESKKGEIVFG